MRAHYLDGLHLALNTVAWATGTATPAIGLLLLYALFTPLAKTTRTRWTAHRLTRAARRSGRLNQS